MCPCVNFALFLLYSALLFPLTYREGSVLFVGTIVAIQQYAFKMGVKITGHQNLVVILSSIKEECQLFKNLNNQLKLILVCSPLILWLKLGQEGVPLGDNNYKVEFFLSRFLGAVVYRTPFVSGKYLKMQII